MRSDGLRVHVSACCQSAGAHVVVAGRHVVSWLGLSSAMLGSSVLVRRDSRSSSFANRLPSAKRNARAAAPSACRTSCCSAPAAARYVRKECTGEWKLAHPTPLFRVAPGAAVQHRLGRVGGVGGPPHSHCQGRRVFRRRTAGLYRQHGQIHCPPQRQGWHTAAAWVHKTLVLTHPPRLPNYTRRTASCTAGLRTSAVCQPWHTGPLRLTASARSSPPAPPSKSGIYPTTLRSR